MPEKFPEVLPPKGEGRVDSKHRVALLTEPEIGALNFLKNMDRAMGFKSGFSPMMQNLAAQNTEPLQYVEYRGERIPSLNDFSEESGGEKNETAGESEARNQTSSGGDYGGSNDWAARERKRKAKEKADQLAAEKLYQKKQKEKKEKEEKRQKDLKDIEDYIAAMSVQTEQSTYTGKDSETLADEEEDQLSELTVTEGADNFNDENEGFEWWEEGGTGIDPGEEPLDEPDEPDDNKGLTEGEFNELVAEYDLEPEFEAYDGSMHWTQDDADAKNESLTTEARSGRETELTDYGSEIATGVYGEIESDFNTYLDDTLGGKRQTAYDQALAGLYDDQQLTGIWDQDAYDSALQGLDAAVVTETGELEDYGTSLKSDAETAYDAWLEEQTAALGEQGFGDIPDWEWGELDLSGFTDDQEYQDFNFLDEFKKIDPEGNTIEADSGDATGTGTTEEGSGDTSARTASRIKKKKKYRTTGNTSLTGEGSSSNIS